VGGLMLDNTSANNNTVSYIVSDPKGQKHIIRGPKGATPDQVISQAQRLIPQGQQSTFQSSQNPQQPFNGMDQQRLLQLFRRANPQGAQQLVSNMIQQRMGGGQDPYRQAMTNLLNAKASQLSGGSSPNMATPQQAIDFL